MEWEQANFKDERRPKLKDLVKLADYRIHEGEFSGYRFVGTIKPACIIRLPIFKDGKPMYSDKIKKNVEIPFYVTNYDTKTGKFIEGKKCPFMELAELMNQYREKPIRPQEIKYVQAINRAVQEDNSDDKGIFRRKAPPTEKEKATRFKDSLNSGCRTPVEVHTVSYQLSQDIAAVMETNKVTKTIEGKKVTKKFSPAHPQFGCDVLIKHDESIKGSKKTFMQKDQTSPLTEDEKRLLQWDMDKAINALTLSESEAKTEAKRLETEFRKSLKNGGGKSGKAEPDLDGLPEDVEGLGLDDDTPAQKPAQRHPNAQQQRRPAPSSDELDFGDGPSKSGGGTNRDEADLLFGSDDGVDLGGDLDDEIPF